jgi:hypothetical protein
MNVKLVGASGENERWYNEGPDFLNDHVVQNGTCTYDHTEYWVEK